jgi:lipopolysaccharide export LptBFGC system permease protein LptF
MALSIGKGGHIPAVVAAWTPNTLFLAIAGLLIIRKS